jgi:hypothetical protein
MSNRRLYVDLDCTIGFHDAATGEWRVYEGARESLRELAQRIPITLLTANTRANVQKLFYQHPAVATCFETAITCEDFAPHFLRIAERHREWVRQGRIDSSHSFLRFVHALWSEDPASALPAGAACEIEPPISYDEWEKKVYFPLIAPDKARICGADGLLIDDEFANPEPNPVYGRMLSERRAFFAGPRGGSGIDQGPHWDKIRESILEVIEC